MRPFGAELTVHSQTETNLVQAQSNLVKPQQ